MNCIVDIPQNSEREKKLFNLFNSFDESLIWSCLQGVMGDIITNDDYSSAIAYLGDFAYLTGIADVQLFNEFRNKCLRNEMILVPLNQKWEQALISCCDNLIKSSRYAIKKEYIIFDQDNLNDIISSLDSRFNLKLIDNYYYNKCLENEWSADFVRNYNDYDEFSKIGLGYVITENEKLVSGASSYSSFNGGIEVEITTHPDYRKLGLATICAAKLITECVNKDLYPSWDARNMTSVRIAEKLGYKFDKEYSVFILKLR